MGATMSMDISGATTITENLDALDTTITAPATPSFEDKLRQESILIPEDIEDIHIQAPESTATVSVSVPNAAVILNDSNFTSQQSGQYGRGKHWKRNMKKKQAASNTASQSQTERTIEQRREQVRPIIDKLTELQMNISYPAIRELYKQLNQFVKTGEDAKIKIAFPEFSRKIKGELSNAPYIPCWVKLELE
jgi:preprotein translocase subunit SecD